MGKASTNKKVARAASTGGGRTARGSKPWGWYATLGLVSILGVGLIVVSRNENISANNPRHGARPRVNADHWHAAIGVYLCDAFAPNIKDSGTDPHGIHTHGDGVIHIHPFDKTAAGKKARLSVFDATVGMTLTQTKLQLAGDSKTYSDNKTKCGKSVGRLTWYVNGKQKAGNPADYKPSDRDKIVVAFAPKGAEIPKTPPSAPALDNLSDVSGSPAATPVTAPGDTSTPTTAGSASSTTAPPATTAPTAATTPPSTTPSSVP